MSLDISVIDESGSVVEYVALVPDSHWELLGLADRHQLNLWTRMRDYYEDADYNSVESKALLADVITLRENCSTLGLVETLARIESLIRRAIERG